MNENERVLYAIFNKHNGVFYNYCRDKEEADNLNKDNFVVRKITLHPGEYFFGDYETGKIYQEHEKPLIREDELEKELVDSIVAECPLIDLLIAVAEVLDANKEIIKTENFDSIFKFIKNKKVRHKHRLKAYSEDRESYNYLSKEKMKEITKKREEGLI